MSGLTLVTAVRDRAARLQRSLAAWTADDAIDEIVVVDWGSEVPLAKLGVLDHPRTVLLTAGAGEPWARGLALNLGIEAATHETVLLLDPGVALADAGRVAAARAARGGYVTGHGATSPVALLRRDDARALGGFNEFLLGEGFEEQDLYNRLEDAGARHRFLHADEFRAVADDAVPQGVLRSPDEIRLELPHGMGRDPAFIRERNKLLAGLVPWTPALAALRPRRIGRIAARRLTVQLGPRTELERRQQDVASYLTGHLIANLDPKAAIPLLGRLIDDRTPADAWRAHRQRQVELALALRGR